MRKTSEWIVQSHGGTDGLFLVCKAQRKQKIEEFQSMAGCGAHKHFFPVKGSLLSYIT